MRAFPVDGGWRVHPEPASLPRRPRFEEGESALNRFDDPVGQYRVRYIASSLRGCLLEVLGASFRVRAAVEDRLAAVTNADPHVGDLIDREKKELEPAGCVPLQWLEAQWVARCHITADEQFVNVMDSGFLAAHNRHPRVRRAIDRHLGDRYDLDAGTILLGLELGRPVTQAVSAVLWDEGHAGIRYVSRLDIEEECWAVFDRVPVSFEVAVPLDPTDDVHRSAVTSAAALLGLRLPEAWTEP